MFDEIEFGILNTLPWSLAVDGAFENIWPFYLKRMVTFNAAMIIAKICSVLKMFLAMEILLKEYSCLVGRLPRNKCMQQK